MRDIVRIVRKEFLLFLQFFFITYVHRVRLHNK